VSRRASLRSCLISGVTLAIGFADVVRAQGQGATAATPPASRDGIADAKKDFDTIKSVRDAALLPNSKMPTVSVPELSLPTSPPTTGTSKAKTNPREAKSPNWLVDAMQKDSSSNQLRDPRIRDRKNRLGERERDVTDENRDEPALAVNDKEAAKIERERRDQREEDVTAAVVANPLNEFLGSWMTPQDYALLKPGLTPSTDAGIATKVSPLPGSINGATPAGGLSDLTRTGSVSPTIAIPPPRENPYLQSLKTELPGAVSTTRRQIEVAPIAPPSRPPTVIAPTPVPVTPSPSKVPDFAKPSGDDRYFKQLKRF
jgi:hypothetical protein